MEFHIVAFFHGYDAFFVLAQISRRGLYDSLEIFPGRGVVRSGHNESFEESNLTNIARGRVLYEDLHMKVGSSVCRIYEASCGFSCHLAGTFS